MKREKTHWISNDSYDKIKTEIYFLLAPFLSSLRTSLCLPYFPLLISLSPFLPRSSLFFVYFAPVHYYESDLKSPDERHPTYTTPPSLLFLQSCQTGGRIKVLIIIVRSNQIIICCNKPILCIFYYKEAIKKKKTVPYYDFPMHNMCIYIYDVLI